MLRAVPGTQEMLSEYSLMILTSAVELRTWALESALDPTPKSASSKLGDLGQVTWCVQASVSLSVKWG